MARPKKAKVQENTDLEKNLETGVVSNTNTNEYLTFIRQRELALSKDEKINKLETEIADLKALVTQLVETMKNG